MFGQHLHLEEEHETSVTVQQHWQQPQMTTGLIRSFHCSAGLLCLPWKTFDWKSSEDIVSNQGCWGRTWIEKKKEKIPQMSQVINSRYITTSQTGNNNKKKRKLSCWQTAMALKAPDVCIPPLLSTALPNLQITLQRNTLHCWIR